MKFSMFCGAAMAALMVGAISTTPLRAQTPAPDTNSSIAPQAPPSVIDNDDMMHLKKVREEVLTANPDLKAEEAKLRTMHDAAMSQNPPPTDEQKNAMFAEWKAYQTKMRAAILKVDPTLAPIFAKLDAARKTGAAPTPFQPATVK